MNQKVDSELLLRLKEGDINAYDAIFLKYFKLLCLNAYFFLKDEQEAKDLVQVFFMEIWEKKLYMKLEGEIRGYLYRSVQNRCLNKLRQLESVQQKSELYTVFNAGESVEEPLPETIFQSLDEALGQLPAQRREAIQIVYLHNKKYQEAADVMGISINSVKTHLKIGLKNLREYINKNKNRLT
ncbi:RNA polymerase sigma-70 factor (family 1) [Pedobacter africanus]|uniref:RNA polymerase sigma-70 factor (ECF subfamily) n=1 Tax=Pedobacter africanus TaxID=151894 RepID=A0ACC6L2C0_9SPHI|nr:sigma-70 family RNA polymerase sigma factor [Pedobacter africanus]MDR6785555.1 RNA polymerase sigma-70 factor (ECF subfamily) [Pedobacter africanus]